MAGEMCSDRWCERLYEERAAGLLLYGRALGLTQSEAEDVLQETFMVLLNLAAPPEEPFHYLARSFRNRALNYKRSLWRRLTRELESRRWFERDGIETPLEKAAMQTLTALPPEQREVIVLKIWSQMTFEQIGSMLSLSPHTVAGRYRYGVEKLRKRLTGIDYERLELPGNQLASLETASAVS